MMNLDSMLGQNHDIFHEFPEYADRINSLKASDTEFARLFAEYNQINREVIRIEQGVEPRSHFYFEELKKRRLWHKDRLWALLRSV